MFPKAVRISDPEYLAWVRTLPCCFCHLGEQRFRTEAHHVIPKRMGGANLRDDTAIPVCTECHMRCGGQTVSGRRPIAMADQETAVGAHRARYAHRHDRKPTRVPW